LIVVAPILFYFAVFIVRITYKRDPFKESLLYVSTRILPVVASMNFLLYITITTKALETFQCSVQLGGTSYLQTDVTIDCNSEFYIKWKNSAIAVVVIYSVCAPLAILAFLLSIVRKHGIMGAKSSNSLLFQMLTGGYEPEFFFWEVVQMVRRFLYVLGVELFNNNASHQIVFLLCVFLLSLLLHMRCEAYEWVVAWKIELASICVIVLTLVSSTWVNDTNNRSDGGSILFSIVAGITNILFVVGTVLVILSNMHTTVVSKKLKSFLSYFDPYEGVKSSLFQSTWNNISKAAKWVVGFSKPDEDYRRLMSLPETRDELVQFMHELNQKNFNSREQINSEEYSSDPDILLTKMSPKKKIQVSSFPSLEDELPKSKVVFNDDD